MESLAELFIAVVGFTGVVIAVRHDSAETGLRAAVMSMLFGFGFSGVVWAILPQVLLGAGIEEPLVWRALSTAFVVTMLVLGVMRRAQARRVGAPLTAVGFAVPFVIVIQLATLVVNVVFGSAALYLGALLCNLAVGLLLFWKLIDPRGTAGRDTTASGAPSDG